MHGLLWPWVYICPLFNAQGMTALMWAARKDKQTAVLKELISAGANVNLQNEEV